MFNYLEQLRQKPEKAKKRFAFLTALSFCGIIFIVWLGVVYPDFTDQKKKDDKVKSLEPSPLSAFFQTISLGASQIGTSLSEIKNITKTFNIGLESFTASTSVATSSPEEKIVNEIEPVLEIYNVAEIEATSTTIIGE